MVVTAHGTYPTGQHPLWCDLNDSDCIRTADPTHVGRTSHLFVQSAEARVSLQLVRHDDAFESGTRAGTVEVKLLVTDPFAQGRHVEAQLTVDEMATLALLCKQYVKMAKREGHFPLHAPADAVRENGPA